MRSKIKSLFQNKWFKLFLPLIFLLLLFSFEFIFDTIAGDGDGRVTLLLFIKFKSVAIFIVFLWFILNIFLFAFKSDKKAAIFNYVFLILTLYGVEYYLYKKDPFLKGPFDSGHYNANANKYKTILSPPNDYMTNYITWGNTSKRNKYNFRDDEIVFPKPKGVFRIMVLGDSFTWGAGLSESEMYSNRLDSLLKVHFKTQAIEVVNCAYSGSPTITERNVLRRLKDTVMPDLVLVGFCMNDPQPKSEDYSREKEEFEKKWGSKLESMRSFFNTVKLQYLGEALSNFSYLMQIKANKIPSFEVALGRCYDKESKDWKNFEKAILDIKNISDSLNCCGPVAGVFTQIGAFDCETDITENEKKSIPIRKAWLNQVNETFLNHGFSTVNFIPVFEKEAKEGKIKGNELMVNPLDGHPSAKMNIVFANELFKKIVPIIKPKLDSLLAFQNNS